MVVEMRLNCTGSWTDYTKNVNLNNYKRLESLNETFDPMREVSGEIEVDGPCYTFVYNSLIDNVNMYSNSICVRITDTSCSSLQTTFKLDNSNLKWCDNNECFMSFDLVEYNLEKDCIKDTLITDNTSGLFQAYPILGNPHPRFRYCDVVQPKWWFDIMIKFFTIFDVVVTTINSVISVINLIISAVNTLPGVSIGPIATISLPYETFSGCDRGFPAPFIRTYIDNVCDVCGLTSNSSTNPIFYSTTNQFNALLSNPYYYATFLTAYTTKGVDMTGAKDWIPNNAPSYTLDTFLSVIKTPWNARWYLHNSNLYFNRKDLIGDDIWGSTPTLDFTTSDADKLLGSVCFSWNGQGKLKRLNMRYSTDASDNSGNEMLKRFNGEYLEPITNVNYKEAKEANLYEVGATQFVLDGQDVLYDSIILNALGSLIGGFNFTGCLKTQGDTLALAKILIYDTASDIDDARTKGDDYLSYIALPAFEDDINSSWSISPFFCKNYNNAMSFDPTANAIEGNLWQYWQIEKADPAKKTNISFEFRLEYCCDFNSLGLYQKVKFKNGWIGELDFIEYDYFKREILLKGNVLY
jgi:hypothetical protein